MLYTNLKHLETAEQHHDIIHRHDNVVVCCGRMDAGSIAAYRALELLEPDFTNVAFFDMEYDNPQSQPIRAIAENEAMDALPFVVVYKHGQVASVVPNIYSVSALRTLLNREFGG